MYPQRNNQLAGGPLMTCADEQRVKELQRVREDYQAASHESIPPIVSGQWATAGASPTTLGHDSAQPRSPLVPIRLSELYQEVAELHRCLAELSQRLEAVLGPSGPTVQDGRSGPSPAACALSEQLADTCHGIIIANRELRDMLSRLEL